MLSAKKRLKIIVEKLSDRFAPLINCLDKLVVEMRETNLMDGILELCRFQFITYKYISNIPVGDDAL